MLKVEKERQVSISSKLSPEAIANAINQEYGLKENPIQPTELIRHLNTVDNNPTYLILHDNSSYSVIVFTDARQIKVKKYIWK